jgi:tellurite resistance protein TehA-like permease
VYGFRPPFKYFSGYMWQSVCLRVVAFILSSGPPSKYLKSKATQPPTNHLQFFPIHNMTPIWIFPACPLLSAPFASNLINSLPGAAEASRVNAIAISLGAVTLQGTGFLLSLNIYGAFVYRLMKRKLPQDTLKPSVVSKTLNLSSPLV